METADPTARRMATPIGPALLVAASFALLCAAWAGANPPGASPDEPSHFIKAYASGTGQIEGSSYQADLTMEDQRSVEWFRSAGRSYLVPARLIPPESVHCYAFDREKTAACQRLDAPPGDPHQLLLTPTHIGTYNPALYFPSGLAAKDAPTFASASSRARSVNAAISVGFVTSAALLMRRRGDVAMAGLALSVTPMVVFLSASITTNGIESAAALCLWAGLICIVRQPGEKGIAPWFAVAVAGSVLALSRPLGAAILATVLLVCGLLSGSEVRSLAAAPLRRRLVLTGGLLGAAFFLSAMWAVVVMPEPGLDLAVAARALDDALGDLPNQARQLVGIFGWNDTTMPLSAYLLALGAVAALAIAALRFGNRRERLALASLAAVVVVADIAIAVLIEAQIGFGMQARYVLPLAVGFPLLAADIVATSTARNGRAVPAWTAPGLFVLAGVLQITAFLANAHRYAVGRSGGWLPMWPSQWSPEGGLAPWLVLAALGALCLFAGGRWARSGGTNARVP